MLALIGVWEVVIILVVLLLVVGTARFAAVGRALRRGGREFKRSVRGEDRPRELPPPDDRP